jgi:hypothetical protein
VNRCTSSAWVPGTLATFLKVLRNASSLAKAAFSNPFADRVSKYISPGPILQCICAYADSASLRSTSPMSAS